MNTVAVRHEPFIVTLPDALTPEECERHVREAESHGFDDAPITVGPGRFRMATEVRNNTRVMRDDPALAALLWERVRAVVPPVVGAWRAVGLNERLRWYRYEPGQYFRWHRDGCFARSDRERSLYTVMFYLNDDFEGGGTEFREEPAVVWPRRGAALVFEHSLLHQGAPVRSGTKYVLRTDAMYARG